MYIYAQARGKAVLTVSEQIRLAYFTYVCYETLIVMVIILSSK